MRCRFVLRAGAVPLRTQDGGKTWTGLMAAAPLFVGGATFKGSLSWTGKTLTLHGTDRTAILRQAFGTAVWKVREAAGRLALIFSR